MLFLIAAAARGDVTSSGAYVSGLPIDAPTFHAIGPRIGLEYNSHAGNGFLGVGWRLTGLSEIRATSATGCAPRGDSMDKFWLDGNELIPCAGGAAGSRIAASPSCKYALAAPYPAHRLFGGVQTTYSAARDILQWVISDIKDPFGNAVHYSYKNSTIGLSPDYPDAITYGQTRVQFYWEPHADVINMAARGDIAHVAQRLKSIDVLVEGKRRCAYALSYHPASGTKRSLIESIKHFGAAAVVDSAGNVSGNPLPPATLSYYEQPPASSWHSSRSPDVTLPAMPSAALPNRYTYQPEIIEHGAFSQFLVGDFDGDGRTDALIFSVLEDPSVASFSGNIGQPEAANLVTHVRLASQKWVRGSVPFTASAHWGDIRFDGRGQILQAWVADVNGDGLDDLILMAWSPTDPNFLEGNLTLQLNAALSNGDGTFRLAQPQFAATPWTTPGVPSAFFANLFPPDGPQCTPGDFDGNGRAHFACTFQDGISKQFLGVAYSTTTGTGGFTMSQPVLIADDPGTLVPGGNTVLPFETRRLAAGDVNNDGQTDLVVLDLNADDASACAALGDPTTNRPDCLIKYDLLTFLSNGAGFTQQRTPTFWVRADYLDAAPGTLTMADLNGDGRADVVFLVGPLRTERFQTIKLIRSALARRDGSYDFHELLVPTALRNTEVAFTFGDSNGDGRADLMVAAPIGPGGGVSCSAVPFTRAVLTIIQAQPDGSFSLPARWDDCSVSREVTDPWAQWPSVINAPGQRQTINGVSLLAVGDSNGDGYADFIMPTILSGNQAPVIFGVYDRVTQPDSTTVRRWIPTDLNGDGKTDFVAVIQQANQVSALGLIAQANGSYQPSIAPLGTFENPSLRTWRDVNGDGKADLVHVQCVDTSVHRACDMTAETFLSLCIWKDSSKAMRYRYDFCLSGRP